MQNNALLSIKGEWLNEPSDEVHFVDAINYLRRHEAKYGEKRERSGEETRYGFVHAAFSEVIDNKFSVLRG